MKAIFSLDIGGTNVRAGFVNKNSAGISGDESYTLTGFTVNGSKALFREEPMKNLIEFIGGQIKSNAPETETIAVSIGFPASIDKRRKTVLSAPNLKGFDNVPVVDELEKALGIPVVLGRDVSLLMSYDCYSLDIDTSGIIIGCYFGTGLGNLIMIGGEILYGKNGVAGELGHIPERFNTQPCGCGLTGCAESFCAGIYLQTITERNFPGTPIGDVFKDHAGHPVLLEYIDGMAIPVAAEVTILDPDYVLLGGGILSMEGFPFDEFEAAIKRHTRKPYPAENLRMVYSRPAQENGVIGAGIYAYRQI